MRRRFAANAEIAGSADQTRTEQVLPDAVDKDPRRQRVLATGDGLCQFQPAAPLTERRRLIAQESDKSARNETAGPVRVPAQKDSRFVGNRVVDEDHRARWSMRTVHHP